MYIDALSKQSGESDLIKIVERVDGIRVYKEYTPDYHFYISDARGTYKSIYGDPLKKIVPKSFTEKQKLVKTISGNVRKWESDIKPISRCLETNYRSGIAPNMHVAFFDIETSFDKINGWSEPSVAANYITAISVHLQWIDEIICLAVPPDTLTWEEAGVMSAKVGNTVLFKTEGEMLNAFIDIIQDADVLSGWNSEAFDVPYTVNRIKKVLGKFELKRLCLWDQMPKERVFERGGRESITFDLVGRVAMDYMQIYKQYNYEERHSYALNAIAEIELGETKIAYEGTLDDLYNHDFETFLEYNLQDTRLLDRLDKKLQFIALANSIAHSSCVLIPAVMGAVAVTDQNVVMEAHSRGMICPDKKHTGKVDSSEAKAAGGWVTTPRKGFHRWIGSTDMKSLYPSVIRALNMSPETIVGQIRLDRTNLQIDEFMAKGGVKHSFAAWWNDRFNVLEMDDFYKKEIASSITLDMEDGSSYTVSGKELHDLIFASGQTWCISANGTIFKTNTEGIIPSLLTRWYAERKVLQSTAEQINQIVSGLNLPEDLLDMFEDDI